MSTVERERERILVVDDDAGMRRMAQRVLAEDYEVAVAAGHEEAMELLRGRPTQVALVDVQLEGGGDGYALCAAIKHAFPETDVILMTGSVSQTSEKLYRSLEQDAFYFLFKPFERRVLRALVERSLRIQRERRAKEAFARALAEDLERARGFQRSLLPQRPLHRSGWYVEGRLRSCDALGGDFFFHIAEPGGHVSLAVCDIVGHGVSAAMFAGMLRSTLDASRRRNPELRELVPDLMKGIDFFRGARYATLFYARLAPDGRLQYFNAGHPPALWLGSDGQVRRLGATGLFLTAEFADRSPGVEELTLQPGDRLLACTDGVTEASDPAGREFGIEGLQAAALRASGREDVLDELEHRLDEHRGGRPRDDDATLLWIAREAAV